MRRLLIGSFALVLGLVAGCGGSGGDQTGADAPLDTLRQQDTARDEVGDSRDAATKDDGTLGVRDGGNALDTVQADSPGSAPADATRDGVIDQDDLPPNPCAPTAIVSLPLSGPGTLAMSGTLTGASYLRPLTSTCTAGPTGPEVVYSLTVPAGAYHLVASTVSPGTTADTVVYAQTACGTSTELACNDDVGLPGPSVASMAVTGPTTVFLVVDCLAANPTPAASAFDLTVSLTVATPAGTACSPVDPGALDPCAEGLLCPPAAGLLAACTPGTAPRLDAAELLPTLDGAADEATLYLSARDGEGDWNVLQLTYRDATGAPLGSEEQELSDFWGQVALDALPLVLAMPASAASVDVVVLDSRALVSTMRHAPLIPWADLGQPCDPALQAPDPCTGDLLCSAGVCATSPAAVSACAQALPITLDSPVSGTAFGLGADRLEGTCRVDRGGGDQVFRAVLPSLPDEAVSWDLIATTVDASIPYSYRVHLDTYLYIRRDCVDPTAELACVDDLTETDLRSEATATNLPPGEYFVILDASSPDQNGTAVTYRLSVHARPVLPGGASCDPSGRDNRCLSGPCAGTPGRCQ